MNRTELKEWFARARRANEEALVGERPLIQEQSTPDLKQSGVHAPQEYIMKDMIGLAFDAGVAVGASQPDKGDQLAGLLEDTIGDMGLLIPPVGQKELKLMKDLLSKIASGQMTDYDPNTTLDHGSFEAEEDFRDSLMNPDYDDDEDDDPLRAMGFEDYQSNDPEDEGFSKEYEDMIKSGRFYNK